MSEWGSIWTIWVDRPAYPGRYVVRRDDLPNTGQGPSFVVTAADLTEARSLLPTGLLLAKRNELENPALVEMWVTMPE